MNFKIVIKVLMRFEYFHYNLAVIFQRAKLNLNFISNIINSHEIIEKIQIILIINKLLKLK